MTLAADEFIRRFLIYVLPPNFHRIATTGCLPAAGVARTSRGRENCSTRRLRHARPAMQPPPMPMSRGRSRIRAPAAADA
jgi:hypothetical protein